MVNKISSFKKVVIVDYGIGNVGSVKNALDFLKVASIISNKSSDMEKASHLILPGVGAFGEGIKKIKKSGTLANLEREVLLKKKPFLGICLGMQLLAEIGEEGGRFKGLGWVKGKVRKFKVYEKKFHLPHVGWNDLMIKKEKPLFSNTQPNIYYFVHSYLLVPQESSVVSALCDYGEKFCAALVKENIFGVQFHPERSQKSGLTLLQNFLNYNS